MPTHACCATLQTPKLVSDQDPSVTDTATSTTTLKHHLTIQLQILNLYHLDFEMPFLDLCHLFFDPAATIESPDSIFGKEWRMTLDYILHEPGLRTAWTSHLSVEHELWAFLCKSARQQTVFVAHLLRQYGSLKTLAPIFITRHMDLGS